MNFIFLVISNQLSLQRNKGKKFRSNSGSINLMVKFKISQKIAIFFPPKILKTFFHVYIYLCSNWSKLTYNMKILRSQNVQNVKLSMTWWWFGGQIVTVWKNEYNLDFLIRLSKELRWQMVNAVVEYVHYRLPNSNWFWDYKAKLNL